MSSSLRGLVFDHFIFGILQARILEWVAIFFSRASSQPRDRTHICCTEGRFFTPQAPRACIRLNSYKIVSKLQLMLRYLEDIW